MKECLNSAIENFADKLDKSKIEDIHKNIELLFNEKVARKDAEAIRKEGLKALTKQREARIMQKYLLAVNFYDLKRIEKQADAIFEKVSKGTPSKAAAREAVNSFLFSNAKYGSISVESVRNAILNRYSIVDHEFRKIAGKLAPDVEDGKFDDQLLKALWEFGEGRDVTLQMEELRGIAKVFHKANAMMSFDKSSINPLYRHRKNYGATLHFDRDRTGAMPFRDWATFIKQHVDLSEMNAQLVEWGIDPKKAKNFAESGMEDPTDFVLKEIYDKITSPESLFQVKPTEGALASAKDPSSVMRSVAEGRMFRYKSAESFAAVFKEFNDGTVYDSMMRSINANARNMAMDQALGKIPLANIQLIKEKMLSKIKDVEERKKADAYFNTNLDYLVNLAAGTVNVNRNRLAEFVANVKAVGTGLLGSAPITAFVTDPVWGAVNYAGLSGDNVFSTYARTLTSTLAKLSPTERIEAAKLTGELIDDVQAITLHQVTGSSIERKKVGALTKLADFGMMMSGMRFQNLVAKTTMAEMFSFGLGRELQGKAGKNSNYVKWLKNYAVDDTDVEILKLALNEKGRLYQESVRTLQPSDVLEVLTKSGKVPLTGIKSIELVESMRLSGKQLEGAKEQIKSIPWTESRVKDYLHHLATKVNTASYDMARMSSPTPTGYTNFVMTGFNISGDKVGSAALQLMLQFKAFGAGVIRNHRFLSNSDNVHAPLRRSAQLGVMLTAAGGVSLMLNDIVSGKAPRDPTAFDEENPIMGNFFTQSLIKSGYIPFIADYLLTDYASEGQNVTSDIIGPSGRMINDVLGVTTELATAPFSDEGFRMKKIVGPLMRWNPVSNLWYTKGVLNTLIQDDLKAALDPKYMRRKMKTMQENSGVLWEQQEFIEPATPISDMGF